MITNIRLQNFRSYTDASFEFDDGVNVIVGPNASGKTNIIEAILVAAQGKSYRAKDNELVKYGAPWARIDADFITKHRVVKLENQAGQTKKSFELDDKSTSRLSTANRVPVVLFEPNHLLMLDGSPELRRSFLDGLIEQTSHEYGAILNKYKRTLLQRNSLLKTNRQKPSNQLFVWDIRLSELAEQIVAARLAAIEKINQQVSLAYSKLADQPNEVVLSYSRQVDPKNYGSYLLKKLEQDQALDILRGFTGAGPHREDILFSLNGQPLATSASRGEARTILLALKTIELSMIEGFNDTKPILLLDDVFSELDGKRRHMLTDFLKTHQVFITTTDADVVSKNLTTSSRITPLG